MVVTDNLQIFEGVVFGRNPRISLMMLANTSVGAISRSGLLRLCYDPGRGPFERLMPETFTSDFSSKDTHQVRTIPAIFLYVKGRPLGIRTLPIPPLESTISHLALS